MTQVQSLQTSITYNNKAMEQQAENIRATQVGGNTVKVSHISENGVTKLQYERLENTELLNSLLVSRSASGVSSAQYDYMKQIVSEIGDPNSKDYLGTRFANIVSSLNVANPSSAGVKQEVLGKVSDFCESVQKYASGLEEVRGKLEEELSDNFTLISEKLRELAEINGQFKGTGGDYALKDRRDQLLQGLSELISIKTSISDTGTVSIRASFSKNGIELLSNNRYASFSYSQSPNASSPNKTVEVTYVNFNGNEGTTTSIDLTKGSIGGHTEGLLKVRDEILPKAMQNIDNTAKEIAKQLNKFHNLGAGTATKNILTSTTDVASTDKAVYTGKSLIGVAGAKPINLDCDTMLKKSGTSILSLEEIIDEINAEATIETKDGICAGVGVYGSPVGGGPTYNLIDRIDLVTSDINAQGQLGVQFRLSSGADVDSTFEVLQAFVDDGAVGAGHNGTITNTAGVFNLKAGQTVKTGQNIVVNLANAGAGTQARLYFQMRVTGTDGTRQVVWGQYNLGAAAGPGVPALAGQDIWNSRFAGIGAAAPAGAVALPGIVNVNAPVAQAKFGAPQVQANIEDGKFVLRGAGNLFILDKAMSISAVGADADTIPQKLSESLHLRDLLTFDKANPATSLSLTDDLAANPDELALAIPSLVAKTPIAVLHGSRTAAANFTLPAGNAANDDNVTINGVTFTFRDVAHMPAPAANTDVLVGVNPAATITNLIAALQAHPSTVLNPLLTFTVNPTNTSQMIATSKFSGTRGNANTIDSAIGGGNVWTNTAGANANALDNGADNVDTGAQSINTYTYEIGQNISDVFAKLSSAIKMDGGRTMSLEHFFNEFLSGISKDSVTSKADKEVAEKTVSSLKTALESATIEDKNAIFLEMVKFKNLNELLYRMIQILEQAQLGVLKIPV